MSEPYWEPLAAAVIPPATSGVWKPGDTKVWRSLRPMPTRPGERGISLTAPRSRPGRQR